jgi:hypothetical protein
VQDDRTKPQSIFQAGPFHEPNAYVGLNRGEGAFGLYAAGFFDAGEQLARAMMQNGGKVDLSIYPLVYVYRHGTELALKQLARSFGEIFRGDTASELAGLKGNEKHSLARLWERVRPNIDSAISLAGPSMEFPGEVGLARSTTSSPNWMRSIPAESSSATPNRSEVLPTCRTSSTSTSESSTRQPSAPRRGAQQGEERRVAARLARARAARGRPPRRLHRAPPPRHGPGQHPRLSRLLRGAPARPPRAAPDAPRRHRAGGGGRLVVASRLSPPPPVHTRRSAKPPISQTPARSTTCARALIRPASSQAPARSFIRPRLVSLGLSLNKTPVGIAGGGLVVSALFSEGLRHPRAHGDAPRSMSARATPCP